MPRSKSMEMNSCHFRSSTNFLNEVDVVRSVEICQRIQGDRPIGNSPWRIAVDSSERNFEIELEEGERRSMKRKEDGRDLPGWRHR